MDSRFTPVLQSPELIKANLRFVSFGQINSFEAACIDLTLQERSQTHDWVFDVTVLSLLIDHVEKSIQYFTPKEFHTARFGVQIMTPQSPIMKELLDYLKHSCHGRFSSPVSRAELAPKLSTYPQVSWSCPSHTRAASLPNNTIITDSFLWAAICQNLDPRLRIVEDCSHNKNWYSRPVFLVESND